MLTTSTAADALGISPSTLRRLDQLTVTVGSLTLVDG